MIKCELTTEQAARLAGVGLGTVHYWVKTSLLAPQTPGTAGHGVGHRWAFLDIIRLRVVARLREGEVSLQKIRKALKRLDTWGESDPLTSARLLALGGDLFWIDSKSQLIAILSQQRALKSVLLVDVVAIAEDTRIQLGIFCAA